MRLLYRARQFWQALNSRPQPQELDEVRTMLSPALMTLFLNMKKSEQAHSIRIFHTLRQQGSQSEELLIAALLHDVGKTRYPLQLWERIEIVLGKALFPEAAGRWGKGAARGWRRAFVTAAQHPDWGAEMVAQAGASALVISLIRRHQESSHETNEQLSHEEILLRRLQSVDDAN